MDVLLENLSVMGLSVGIASATRDSTLTRDEKNGHDLSTFTRCCMYTGAACGLLVGALRVGVILTRKN